MDTTAIIIVAAVVVIVAIGVAVFMQRRTKTLQSRFGSEYDRTVDETGGRMKAERELSQRAKRVESFDIRPLDPNDRMAYIERWRGIQAQFVDDPGAAVAGADRLLGEVMRKRGYPVADFEQRAADLSVDHADVVDNYRAAHEIAMRHDRGDAGTEDLRQAMIHCRALFEDLVGLPDGRDRQTQREEERHVRH